VVGAISGDGFPVEKFHFQKAEIDWPGLTIKHSILATLLRAALANKAIVDIMTSPRGASPGELLNALFASPLPRRLWANMSHDAIHKTTSI